MNIPLLTAATIADLERELAARRAAIEAARSEEPDPPVPAFRVTVDILDHERHARDAAGVIALFENSLFYANVVEVRQKDIPDWRDDNPLNLCDKADAAHDAWFKDAPVVWRRGS